MEVTHDLATAPGLARALLEFYREDGSNWTDEYFARDQHGTAVPPEDEHATCFCMWGAIYRLAGLASKSAHAFNQCLPENIETAGARLADAISARADWTRGRARSLAHINDEAGSFAKLRPLLQRVAAESQP